MGGSAGWLASCGALGGADLIVIPEKLAKFKNFLKVLKEKYKKNKGYAIIILAHQANFDQKIKALYFEKKDEYGISRPLFISLGLKKEIENTLNCCEVKIAVPGNFLSACNPIPFDKKYAVLLGKNAVLLLKQKKFGFLSCVKKVAKKLQITATPLDKTINKDKPTKLNNSFFDFEKFYPKKRFFEYIKPILK
jgi:6-phosphofructokinase